MGICWSPELAIFCVVGNTSKVMTSPDGINWNLHTIPVIYDWHNVCWFPELGIFCAVVTTEMGGNTGNRIMTSSDEITWTLRYLGILSASFFVICWSPELSIFFIVSSGSSLQTSFSYDGINWIVGIESISNINNFLKIMLVFTI